MRTDPTTTETDPGSPLGKRVVPPKEAEANGGWKRTGRRAAYDVWTHSDGRVATVPPGHTPDVKLMPKEKQA